MDGREDVVYTVRKSQQRAIVIQWYVLHIGKSENSSVLEASYIQYSIYYSYIRYILHCMLVPGTVPYLLVERQKCR